MKPDPVVFVVDDDEALRKSLSRMIEAAGLAVETYPSAQAYLEQYDPDRPGCLILDIQMPEMSGIELQHELTCNGRSIPMIMISAHSDTEVTVSAMKGGAIDFLKKPYKGAVLLERIHQSIKEDARRRRAEAERRKTRARLDVLSPREFEVMGYLIEGRSVKQIAYELGLSRKTVDVHHGHIMLKLNAQSVVDLVRMWQSK